MRNTSGYEIIVKSEKQIKDKNKARIKQVPNGTTKSFSLISYEESEFEIVKEREKNLPLTYIFDSVAIELGFRKPIVKTNILIGTLNTKHLIKENG